MSKSFGFIGSHTGIPATCIDPVFSAVEKAKSQGYKTGVSSGLPGIELWGAYTTLLADLELHLVLPFKGWEYYYVAKQFAGDLDSVDFYHYCLKEATAISYAEVVPQEFAELSEEGKKLWTVANLEKKNKKIVDKVELVISLWDYQDKHLLYGLRYAVEKGVKIANLNPATAQWKIITREDLWQEVT